MGASKRFDQRINPLCYISKTEVTLGEMTHIHQMFSGYYICFILFKNRIIGKIEIST